MQGTDEPLPEHVEGGDTRPEESTAPEGVERGGELLTDRRPTVDLAESNESPVDKPSPEDVMRNEHSSTDKSAPEDSVAEQPTSDFAPPMQVVESVAALTQAIGQTILIHIALMAIYKTDPVEFKQMEVLARVVWSNVIFLTAWCNYMRRRTVHELSSWKARHGQVFVAFTVGLQHLGRNAEIILKYTLGALTKQASLIDKIYRSWRILNALYFSLEMKRCLNNMTWIIIKRDPGSLNNIRQPYLCHELPFKFKFMFETLQSASLYLEQFDAALWKDVRIRLSAWGIEQFDEPMTLDFIMQQDDVQTLKESILEGVSCLLYTSPSPRD